jgi:hypothetical protein
MNHRTLDNESKRTALSIVGANGGISSNRVQGTGMFSSGTARVFSVAAGNESPLLGVWLWLGTGAPLNWAGVGPEANWDATWTCAHGTGVRGRIYELTEDPLLLDEEHGLHETSMQVYLGIGFHLHLSRHFSATCACYATAAFFLSLRFMRLPRRFAASTPFSSYVNTFFGALAFVSRPLRWRHALSPREMRSPSGLGRRVRWFARIPWREHPS